MAAVTVEMLDDKTAVGSEKRTAARKVGRKVDQTADKMAALMVEQTAVWMVS